MVIICDTPYINSDYEAHFTKYGFELSDFQKYAIQSIVDGGHTLVTAHTGSGKTLPAEFAIEHFTSQGKKVVYTSPIKALSNQKYYEFAQKYPHISFGIFTGDIKINANAQVLIMTTEILKNYLFVHENSVDDNKDSTENIQNNYDFQLNIDEELACVVFDEVHYINDAERGQNWEQAILMLPKHVQMVMLSATIDAPERFAKWCERGDDSKPVTLCSTNHRVVPLTHYGFLTTHEGIFKRIKDKEIQKLIREKTNKFITLRGSDEKYDQSGYDQLRTTIQHYDKNNIFVNKTHVLNQLVFHLREQEMLPAIAFVFSRKMVETYAKAIQTNILEFDSKVPYTMRNECDKIMRKLPNYEEYMRLPEYDELTKLLEKGIGFHHSGMIPIFREIVEKMISKGAVKLLFATESFAIGLDCPIRTAVFTSLTKFDGNNMRYLLPHEYSQAAGRAGRRGLDTIGHVVHCNNMFELPTSNEYNDILCGKPQMLISKFYISFSVVLNLIKNGKTAQSDFEVFVKRSMLSGELEKQINAEQSCFEKLTEKIDRQCRICDNLRTERNVIDDYIRLTTNEIDGVFKKMSGKQKKEQDRQIANLKDNYKYLIQDHSETVKLDMLQKEGAKSREVIDYYNCYIESRVDNVCKFLSNRKLVDIQEDQVILTQKGNIAAQISEVNSIIMTELVEEWDYFADFSPIQVVGVLSLFSDVRVNEDQRTSIVKTDDTFLKEKLTNIGDLVDSLAGMEGTFDFNSGANYNIVYDMIGPMMEWCELQDEQQCKYFIQTRLHDLELGLGDFCKGILKVSSVARELTKICISMGRSDAYENMAKIEGMLLKFVATNQSLYV
jgi:superfamily II RNA helicase